MGLPNYTLAIPAVPAKTKSPVGKEIDALAAYKPPAGQPAPVTVVVFTSKSFVRGSTVLLPLSLVSFLSLSLSLCILLLKGEDTAYSECV